MLRRFLILRSGDRWTLLYRMPCPPDQRRRLAERQAQMRALLRRAEEEETYWFLRGDVACDLRRVVVLAGERNRRVQVRLPSDNPLGAPPPNPGDIFRPMMSKPWGRWCWSSDNLYEILQLRGMFENFQRRKRRLELASQDGRWGAAYWFLLPELGCELTNISVLHPGGPGRSAPGQFEQLPA